MMTDSDWVHPLAALEAKVSGEHFACPDAPSAIPLGTAHKQINGSAFAIAGGKAEML